MTLPVLLALLLTAAAEEGDSRPLASDARLNDLSFLDARHGWAVGDRGTIWHTDDGGQNWQLQESGVSCPLSAVCFRNETLGWAAGGFAHPYTHSSTGVVLTTRDGGRTWSSTAKLALPALRRIHFFDDRRGWAIGCPSALYPSGVLVTEDGGRDWRPMSGGDGDAWLAGDFADPQTGALAGGEGSIAMVRNGEIDFRRRDGIALRDFSQLRLSDARHGWLVGDGGLMLTLSDRGATWQAPPTDFSAARHFDFKALAVRGSQCWMAGTPGTCVLHTADGGRTWVTFATGSSVPLRAIAFADDIHGWAAGDLGTILATSDGGRTWQQQRSGGSRAAILGLFADAEDVPLELIARLGNHDGYLAAIEILGRRDIETPSSGYAPLADRLQEAITRVGGSSADMAWQFPLRQAGLRLGAEQIVAAWDRLYDSRGLEAMQAHIVRQIRVWRPDLIVTNDSGRRDDPIGSLVQQTVLQAVTKAADPAGFADQLTEAGLQPWKVKLVYAAAPVGMQGTMDLLTAQPASPTGETLTDLASESRGLLEDEAKVAPQTLAFRLLTAGTTPAADHRDFFAGIRLPPGGEARRATTPDASQSPDAVPRTARRRQYVQAILEQSEHQGWTAEQLLARTNELTRDLGEHSAGQLLYQLADRYRRAGRWTLAAETFQSFSERFPNHPLTPPALLWLVQFYASEEAAWQTQCDKSQYEKRYHRALEIAKSLEQNRPEWFAEPRLQFPLAAACRNLNQPRQAERYYSLQSLGGEQNAWWACAQSELHLVAGKGQPKKPTLSCVRAASRPHLDGQLDDPVWQQVKPAQLQSQQHDDGQWPAEVMLAYDDAFLYVAARCKRNTAFQNGAPFSNPRLRDADLSSYDRVELLLDLDRDFVTYYRLVVDDRGWTNDSWWGSSTWDPTWYVASARTDDTWTFEAAIPLDQLTSEPPKPHDTWAIGVQRIVPGVGFQSWSNPAGVVVRPEGFGYLVFE